MIDQNDTDCELNVSIGEMLFHFSSNYSAIFYIFSFARKGQESTNCCSARALNHRSGRQELEYQSIIPFGINCYFRPKLTRKD